jgi:hypothetical protein
VWTEAVKLQLPHDGTSYRHPCSQRASSSGWCADAWKAKRRFNHEEELIFACGAIALSIGAANAGPCKHYRAGRWLRTDLGLYRSDHRHSSAKTPAHLPTDTMNGVAGDKAMPSQDAHAQQQGHATQ